MTYKVSLSKLFKEQFAQIKEFDTILNSKKIAQNIKLTVKDLEKMQKSGIDIETTRIKSQVATTQYVVVYKVQESTLTKN